MNAAGSQLVAELTRLGVEVELISPGGLMPTVPLAAAAIGVNESAIVKSVLFDDHAGIVVLAIANSSNRISRKALANAIQAEKLWLAPPSLVLEQTGFPAGGVAPVGHARSIPIVIDQRVMLETWVYGGGGSEDALLKIRPSAIAACTGAKIADIIEPNLD